MGVHSAVWEERLSSPLRLVYQVSGELLAAATTAIRCTAAAWSEESRSVHVLDGRASETRQKRLAGEW